MIELSDPDIDAPAYVSTRAIKFIKKSDIIDAI